MATVTTDSVSQNCSTLTGLPQFECEIQAAIPLPFWVDCVIVGGVVLLILLIIIVVCIVKKRKKGLYNRIPGSDEPDGETGTDNLGRNGKKDADSEGDNGEEGGNVGSLQITINYENKRQMLFVHIVKASELRVNQTGTCNPYCRCFLEEDRKHYGESSVKEHTTNPDFDYKWESKIPVKEVMGKTVIIAVYDADKLAKNKNIGYLRIPLAEKNGEIVRKGVKDEWRNLQPITSAIEATKPGEVCLSLQYIAGESKLIIVVFECKALRRSEIKESLSPFLHVQLKQRVKKETKKKSSDAPGMTNGLINSNEQAKIKLKVLKTYNTTVKRKTNDPYYNEEFQFNAKLETMKEAELHVTVFHDAGVSAVKIGRLVFSKRSPGSAGEHWKEAMNAAAGRPVAQWHTLQQPHKK